MNVNDLIQKPGEWSRAAGPNHEIVISSRVRLARNLRDAAFPGWAKKQERVETLDKIYPVVEDLNEMGDEHLAERFESLNALHKQVLVERHLISREQAAKNLGSAVVMSKDQSLSIMINEEDHIRMQVLRSGLQLKEAYKVADQVDSDLEQHLDFAFHVELGYLTACPTNVGTGMRASAMLHLPGLALTERINQVIHAINKIGLAVRGLYGEGSEALGNLFQISNQTTLGESESEILDRLEKVVENVIVHEQNARESLLNNRLNTLRDQIGRSYGVLTNAYRLTSKETLNLLSIARLGLDLGAYPRESQSTIDELFIKIQPAHLQLACEKKLEVEERDELRAEIIREKLKNFPAPSIIIKATGEDGSDKENLTDTNHDE